MKGVQPRSYAPACCSSSAHAQQTAHQTVVRQSCDHDCHSELGRLCRATAATPGLASVTGRGTWVSVVPNCCCSASCGADMLSSGLPAQMAGNHWWSLSAQKLALNTACPACPASKGTEERAWLNLPLLQGPGPCQRCSRASSSHGTKLWASRIQHSSSRRPSDWCQDPCKGHSVPTQ